MLEIKPNCEHCGVVLPNESTTAFICSFECTFCKDCVDNVLFNVCPNCGGGFEKRPTRPTILVEKYPVSQTIFTNKIDENLFEEKLLKYKHIPPNMR